MKLWKPLVAGVGALVVTTVAIVPVERMVRGVQLVGEAETTGTIAFDPSQSAALCIGVASFPKDSTLEIPYAADDAVDLAYKFAMDPRVRLVPPERVVIALSGPPRKDISKKRLQELLEAGAKKEPAGPSDILRLLEKQAAKAGPGGILIVSVASHGFTRDGVQHILGSSSILEYPETALQMPRLLEIAARSAALRSLLLIDSCRNRLTEGTRGSPAIAPSITRMNRTSGQIVFSAATTGGYAYEGDGNGVFTKAVLDGMSCMASLERGAVTFRTLQTFVEREVRMWIRKHRNTSIRAATHVSMDGSSQNMPLSICVPPRPPPPDDVDRVVRDGSTVFAFAANGARLWKATVPGEILDAEGVDLDANGSHEVVVAGDTITVLDHTGKLAWSVAEEGLTLRQVFIADLLQNDPNHQIVALWEGGGSSTSSQVTMYAADGRRLSAYEHAGHLSHIAMDRPTSRHGYKFIVAGVDDHANATVVLLDTRTKPVWAGILLPPTERIDRLEVIDHDNDATRDIAVTTASGSSIYLDFAGKSLDGKPPSPHVQFHRLGRRK
jgi:hypothetical protein